MSASEQEPPGISINPYAPPLGDSDALMPLSGVDGMAMADRGDRLLARIIDGAIFLATFVPLILAAVLKMAELQIAGKPIPAGEGSQGEGSQIGFIILASLGVLLPMALIGYQWYLLATTGQTIGKRAMKIKIVRSSGAPVDFGRAVALRNWVVAAIGLVPGGSLVQLVDALLILRESQQCLHDNIADTKVVKKPLV